MQRRIDQRNYKALMDARRVVSEVFDSAGTDWFPDEQASLHEAITSLSRVVDSLQQETAIKAIARRIVANDLRDILRGTQPKSLRDMLWRTEPVDPMAPEDSRQEDREKADRDEAEA